MAHHEERARQLAMEKAQLNLLIHMMSRMSTVTGLENAVENLLQVILSNIGGVNLVLYYWIDDEIFSADVFGTKEKIGKIGDPLVAQAADTHLFSEHEHDFGDTQMITPEFTKARTWVIPLLVGADLIGVLKIEGLHISSDSMKQHLPAFTNYVALLLKNEILGHTRLQRTYDQLREAHEKLTTEVAERKLAETALRAVEAQNRQLLKAESLGRMAGAIAHHFNNQLGVVMGNLELAMMELPEGGKPQTMIATAIRASNRAAQMSRQMLIYLGQSFDTREPLDLSSACQQGMAVLRSVMPVNVTLETTLPSPGPMVKTNPDYIQQILTNLITNAREALGDSSGSISLQVKRVLPRDIPADSRFPTDWTPQEITYACLEVRDTGCGVAAPDLEKIFDPFFTTRFPGRGMGLAVVLGIVKSHGGVVIVESELKRGTNFQVYLPMIPENGLRHTENKSDADPDQR